jgi:hypothetical protein
MSKPTSDSVDQTSSEFRRGAIPSYRAYTIGWRGRIVGVAELSDCADDLSAIKAAERISKGYVVEVWDRGRLVVKIEPHENA